MWKFESDVSRRTRLQTFFKIGALKNFAIFTGKHLRWRLVLIELAWRPATLLNRHSKLFSCQNCEIFKNSSFNRAPLVAASVPKFKFEAHNKTICKRRIQIPVRHLRWSFFVKLVHDWELLCIVAKSSILDGWQCSEYVPVVFYKPFKKFSDFKIHWQVNSDFWNNWDQWSKDVPEDFSNLFTIQPFLEQSFVTQNTLEPLILSPYLVVGS